MTQFKRVGLVLLLALLPVTVWASAGVPAVTLETTEGGGQQYTVTLQILALMTALTLLPAAVLMMTSFTRIIIVLAILRQALGMAQTPSNQVLLGLTLFLSFFVMEPVINKSYTEGIKPYMDEKISADVALARTVGPLKTFMTHQTREDDLALYADITGRKIDSKDDIPLSLLIPAFVTSELKTAFQIGFLIFIPFVVIDLVVASVLMSMGMMMLSPMIVSLPFKLMLFVLVDGWALIMGTLVASFYV